MIKSSLDWSEIELDLLHKANTIQNGRDVKKMIHNIGLRISELSKSEVDARRGKKHKAEEILRQVNEEIEMVREYLLFAAILG